MFKQRNSNYHTRILMNTPATFVTNNFRNLNTNLSRFLIGKQNTTGIPIYDINDELICEFIVNEHPGVLKRISLEAAVYIYKYLLESNCSVNRTSSDIIHSYPYLTRIRIRKGITISIDNEQKIKKYKTINTEDATCVICLDSIGHCESVYKLKCGHVFHDHVEDWFANHNKCPLCRTSIF